MADVVITTPRGGLGLDEIKGGEEGFIEGGGETIVRRRGK